MVSFEICSTLCIRDVLGYGQTQPNIGYSFIKSRITVTRRAELELMRELIDRKKRQWPPERESLTT
jgi:hypothetical protein